MNHSILTSVMHVQQHPQPPWNHKNQSLYYIAFVFQLEFHRNSCNNIDIECLCKTMQTGANNMHLRLKVSLILIATTLQNHTYVGDNTNSAKMFLTGLNYI